MEELTQQQRRDIALLLIAVDSMPFDCDNLRSAVAYAMRLENTVNTDPIWANGRHEGDCTKQPMTCARCLIEKYETVADALNKWDDGIEFIPELIEKVGK